MSGHSVVQLPVPPLEEWVRARTAHYDVGFVSADPRFAHAHITVLGPFDPDPDADTMSALGDLAADTAPFTLRLGQVAQFPNGIIHLVPEPAGPLRDLTARVMTAFPDWVPYRGEFGTRAEDLQPHLTLDAAGPGVDVASTTALLGEVIPAEVVVDRLQLAWWESGNSHLMREWSLGPR